MARGISAWGSLRTGHHRCCCFSGFTSDLDSQESCFSGSFVCVVDSEAQNIAAVASAGISTPESVYKIGHAVEVPGVSVGISIPWHPLFSLWYGRLGTPPQ